MVAFCLGMCYPPTDQDMTSPGSFQIEAGQSTTHNDFYATLEHGGYVGTTIIKFRFFDVNNQNDYAEYRCIFHVNYSSVEDEYITQISISETYPNPVNNTLQFDFNNYSELVNPTLKILDYQGKIAKSCILDNNNQKIIINISDLSAGAYLYYIDFNGKKSKTRRFIIAR